ncbi:MAG: DNA gyrase subunit A [Methanomicrobia archaeon]|nr:DNA gyrase subunit A [Methanomicrobia archaeon]RLF95864.1 MAG: DNA gyrase subunit A [Thermococci archaeon]
MEKVVEKQIEQEVKSSFLDYAMSVIVDRALPDIRDGLKPVHRRILYGMHTMGMFHNKPYKKSARVVGEVLGKYHPHGDVAVYDSIVRMVQPFSLRYPLIDGQGNFGSVDGDSAAAMRYTEVRLAKIAEEILTDIDKNTVDFKPNFDNTLKEPEVLPAKLPNLLINGSSGIAVGMATNIPPHNIKEVIDAIVGVIDNPDIEIEDLMQIIKGPDFPTGGIIYGKEGIVDAYKTGRGRVVIRAKVSIETDKKNNIIIEELPYQVNKARLIENIVELVKLKKIEGISDIRDESDKRGIRVFIKLKADANPNMVLNQLYAHTSLQTTFGVIMLALVDGVPKILNLKEIINEYLKYRENVVIRRTKYELRQAEKRAHILEGFVKALDNIDEVIQIIKKSENVETAKKRLIERFEFTEVQSDAILKMQLQRLTNLEREKIRKELAELKGVISKLKAILASREKIFQIIKEELLEIKEKYGDERRTEITYTTREIEEEDLIPEENVVVTLSNLGYIKKINIDEYRLQRRGGKGVIGMGTKEEDFTKAVFTCSTHDYILFFTNKGKVYWLKAYHIPTAGRTAKGRAIVNLIQMERDEKISAAIPLSNFEGYLFMATKNGTVKKTKLKDYSNPRKTGIIAIDLREEDELVNVVLTDGNKDIILSTKKGKCMKFSEKDVRPTGRNTMGVRGIRLQNDTVVSLDIAEKGKTLFTITEGGYGKRTRMEEYPIHRRGGKGVINIRLKHGDVVSSKCIDENDEILVITEKGIMIRIKAKDISIIGRNTQGVRVIRVENDSVVDIAKISD